MSVRWIALAALATPGLSGCMAGTNSLRPEPLMPGKLRVGLVQGLARNYADDFAFAPPTGEQKTRTSPVWLGELSAHYGLVRDLDLGVRLHLGSLGGKVEALYQIVRERTLGVGVSIGAGVDGFYRSRHRIGCLTDADGQVTDGCFSRWFGGMMVDAPLVVSRHLWSRGTLFVAGRYLHLFMWGEERLKSQTGAFAPQTNDKSFNQWGAGWVVGLEVEFRWLRVTPQLAGATTRMPDDGIKHVIYPALEVAGVF